MKNDIPNIPNCLHISDPNLLWYEFHHMVINFITIFPWYFEINLCQLLLEDFFCSTQKMHVSEYVCKICLREEGILLKCRKAFEIFLAECNSSKNTGLPQFFFIGFWQLYFNSLLWNVVKWPNTLLKSCSKCCKNFKVCLTIFQHCKVNG